MERYIGLMSGTSLDGIDAVLLEVDGQSLQAQRHHHVDYEETLLARLRRAVQSPSTLTVDELGALDTLVGEAFAQAALGLLDACGLQAAQVRAIGSHGQTLRHQPSAAAPFTLQVGDPNRIAEHTGIDVVADFRRRDLAAGGEGAPLVPAFHAALFTRPGHTRVIANIGGIANITVLGRDGRVIGFDTGPGNCLMDGWALQHLGQPFDASGALAASGRVNDALLQRLQAEPFLHRPPPKSTGRELFHLDWLAAHLAQCPVPKVADVQATLCEFTALSLADAIRGAAPDAADLLLCGGGVRNAQLLARLGEALPGLALHSTATLGIDPLHVEAAAFAWLAQQRLAGAAGNLPAVTGACGPRPLGGVYAGAVTQKNSAQRTLAG